MAPHHVNDHRTAASSARLMPGTWVFAGEFNSSVSAKSSANGIRDGRFPAYQPRGAWEAYAAPAGDTESVWVRFIGHGETVKPLPDTMTVRVADRGTGRGYEGVNVVSVTISTRCPQCGAPRGWDTVKVNRFPEDGAWYTVDVWTNPCGHEDRYAAVLTESRRRPVPGVRSESGPRAVVLPAQATGPVELILKAASETKGMHGQQAAHLLTQHGYAEEAAAVQAELSARGGHMSARQAAEFLHIVSAPAPAVDLAEEAAK